MGEIVFSAKSVTKQYRKKNMGEKFNALDKFNMEIRRGDIYGFVGKNGAGKTTLMRILTGRIGQTSGEIELFGKKEKKELSVYRRHIGAVIESPAVYPGMTARDNLEVLRLQCGIQGTDCISDVLKTVRLEDVGTKRVKDFSLGMKQRLGLAMALLGNKEFLVLDEPVNGLDPEGIIEFREILKKLNKEYGTTILVSSHLLEELDQIATYYGFIHKGKMVEEISSKKIWEKCSPYLSISVDDVLKAKEILGKMFPKQEVEIVKGHKIHIYDFSGDTEIIMRMLVEDNVYIREMTVERVKLEEYYMSVIGRG